ncbi:hypothetical protein [Mesorhizobium sp.]|uniref:hypothetical protein n=1 Tax=Mesorhizobium sp. TaxID=1871066 RepID=UPI0025BB622D|nr:hypothetical protein [Mesorhizobium sp.]
MGRETGHAEADILPGTEPSRTRSNRPLPPKDSPLFCEFALDEAPDCEAAAQHVAHDPRQPIHGRGARFGKLIVRVSS